MISGSVNPINLPFHQDYWLKIEVGILGALLPRARLTSVGYAFRAEWADTSDYSFKALRADTADYATVALAAESHRDWTISGNDTYSALLGNVGIGTNSPERPWRIWDVMRLKPHASAPTSPSEGDIHVNSSDHHIHCYLNGVWTQPD